MGRKQSNRDLSDRGYFGLAIINCKSEVNYGSLLRSAYNFGADFVIVVGKRFKKQVSDTLNTYKHMPIFEASLDDFRDYIPYDCIPIAVECLDDATPLQDFMHPERALYILGPEDGSIPSDIVRSCPRWVRIPSDSCLNLAVAGSIVMYDRVAKRTRGVTAVTE